jgi:hypothetical protein
MKKEETSLPFDLFKKDKRNTAEAYKATKDELNMYASYAAFNAQNP